MSPPHFSTLPSCLSEESFLEAVLAHPHDDAPRLAFADWLEERGDPRGEFIRVQCELAASLPPSKTWPEPIPVEGPEYRRLGELQNREAELLLAYSADWSAPFQEIAAGVGFRRGFVEHVQLPCDAVRQRLPALRGLTPLLALTLSGDRRELPSVVHSAQMQNIEALAFHAMHLGHAGAEAIASSSEIPRLRALDLSNCGIEVEGLGTLGEAPRLMNLDIVILNMNRDLGGGSRAVEFLQSWPSLSWLELANCALTDDDVRMFSTWPSLSRLKVLNLSGNTLSGAALETITRSPYWTRDTLLIIEKHKLRSLRSDRSNEIENLVAHLRSVSQMKKLASLNRSALPWGVPPRWRSR